MRETEKLLIKLQLFIESEKAYIEIKVENKNYMPLVLEKFDNKVSIFHYFYVKEEFYYDHYIIIDLTTKEPTYHETPTGYRNCDSLKDKKEIDFYIIKDWVKNLEEYGFIRLLNIQMKRCQMKVL